VALQYCTFNLAVTKKTVGDGEKLLTYLNSALKLLLGLDIFPRGTNKMLNFVDQCYEMIPAGLLPATVRWRLFRGVRGWDF
jgi:hypothetical protein